MCVSVGKGLCAGRLVAVLSAHTHSFSAGGVIGTRTVDEIDVRSGGVHTRYDCFLW